MKLMQDGEKATDWHFRVGSLFAKALVDHVINASEKDCIIDRGGRTVMFARGTGAVIRFVRPIVHFAMPGEVEMMSCQIEVVLCPNEEDLDEGHDHERGIQVTERIHFPSDLELNYSKPKFDLWINEMRKTLREQRAYPDHKALAKLIRKYPEKALELITKRKPKGS